MPPRSHPMVGPAPARPAGTAPPTWRERAAALRHVPVLVKMVWQTHRGYTAAMIVLRVVRSLVPIATLWVGKLIIDIVVASLSTSPDYDRLWRLVALEIGIV